MIERMQPGKAECSVRRCFSRPERSETGEYRLNREKLIARRYSDPNIGARSGEIPPMTSKNHFQAVFLRRVRIENKEICRLTRVKLDSRRYSGTCHRAENAKITAWRGRITFLGGNPELYNMVVNEIYRLGQLNLFPRRYPNCISEIVCCSLHTVFQIKHKSHSSLPFTPAPLFPHATHEFSR